MQAGDGELRIAALELAEDPLPREEDHLDPAGVIRLHDQGGAAHVHGLRVGGDALAGYGMPVPKEPDVGFAVAPADAVEEYLQDVLSLPQSETLPVRGTSGWYRA